MKGMDILHVVEALSKVAYEVSTTIADAKDYRDLVMHAIACLNYCNTALLAARMGRVQNIKQDAGLP